MAIFAELSKMEQMIRKLLVGLMVMGLLFGHIGSTTGAYFIDAETSVDNELIIATSWGPTTLLDDGFEGEPRDTNWDNNGTTNWIRTDIFPHSGLYSASCNRFFNGYLTSDDLNASGAVSITVSFWFLPWDTEAGDMLVQLYNGSTYNTLYDLAGYPTWQNKSWCYFSEKITDSQYFNSNFRLRFDSSGLVDTIEKHGIDDVLITME